VKKRWLGEWIVLGLLLGLVLALLVLSPFVVNGTNWRNWILLCFAIFGVFLTSAVAVVATAQVKQRAQHGPQLQEVEIGFRPDAEKDGDWDARVGQVRDLMANQDTITWTVAAISFGAQAALAGFYFQSSRTGQLLLPIVGIFAALVLLSCVARSNWYMAAYQNTLHRTGREEYQLVGPRLVPPSATLVVYGVHSVIAFTWLVTLVASGLLGL
jgi:hypothetical protein